MLAARRTIHEVVGPVAVDDVPCHHEAHPFPHLRIGRYRQPHEHHVLDDAGSTHVASLEGLGKHEEAIEDDMRAEPEAAQDDRPLGTVR